MRLVLSRKGFDSSAGGHDSPVLPDGRIVSLPIPGPPGPLYRELKVDDENSYADLMLRLGINSVNHVPVSEAQAHADPDLDRSRSHRVAGWLPMFGQADAAQTHLRNQGVAEGDVFLFFGRFRHTEETGSRRLRYKGDPFHLIWGYLEVGAVIDVASAGTFEPWMLEHVHVSSRNDIGWRSNTVYVAKEVSSLGRDLPGGGTFRSYRPELRLTKTGGPLSSWRLPLALHPSRTTHALTYNPPARWAVDGLDAVVSVASRGQEFVVDVNDGVREWLGQLQRSQPDP